MTDFGRRPDVMLKSVYDTNDDGKVDTVENVPAHKASHQTGGGDQLTVQGLPGELAAAQLSTWAKVGGKPTTFAPSAHKTSHQSGGGDQLDLTDLIGKSIYVNRGDTGVPDYQAAYWITGMAWHDLDLSELVPSPAVAVHLHLSLIDGASGRTLQFRTKGQVQNINVARINTTVAWVVENLDVILACDENQFIQYMCATDCCAIANCVIAGWFI